MEFKVFFKYRYYFPNILYLNIMGWIRNSKNSKLDPDPQHWMLGLLPSGPCVDCGCIRPLPYCWPVFRIHINCIQIRSKIGIRIQDTYFLTLPGINIKLFINIRFSNLKKSSERYTGNVLKLKLFCGESFKTLDPEPDLENPGSGFETLVLANCPFPTCKIAWPCEM